VSHVVHLGYKVWGSYVWATRCRRLGGEPKQPTNPPTTQVVINQGSKHEGSHRASARFRRDGRRFHRWHLRLWALHHGCPRAGTRSDRTGCGNGTAHLRMVLGQRPHREATVSRRWGDRSVRSWLPSASKNNTFVHPTFPHTYFLRHVLLFRYA
jgi:hypothetical protein